MKKLHFILMLIFFIMVVIIIPHFMTTTSNDLNSILKKYKAQNTEFIYYNKKNMNIERAEYSHFTKQKLYQMKDTDQLLYYKFSQKQRKPNENPVELHALFNIWLTLKESNQEYKNIFAVASLYEVSNLSYDIHEEILVLREEFEELLPQTNHISSRDEKISIMANLWIKKYHYNRYGLKTSYSSLLTPWSDSYYSINDTLEYGAHFSNFYNSFDIMKINYSKHTKSAKAVFSEELNECGFLYGVWEDSLDFWTWGETTGFSYFHYVGNETWLKQDDTNHSPPEILQKISNDVSGTKVP